MKRILALIILVTCLFSCKRNNSQTIESDNTIQRDTVKDNKLVRSEKDSIINNGEYIQYYKNGVTKMRGMMKEGKREGVWKSFYETGSPWSETTFKDGKKDGKTTTWYENEKKRYDGFYTNDVESGKWVYWNEKGELVTEKNYDVK
jgi:antitoxin component YwqK of YwqJK toxin-antitoxin module